VLGRPDESHITMSSEPTHAVARGSRAALLTRRSPHFVAASALALLASGCGGLVVYEGEPGEGGASTTVSSSSSPTSSSSGPTLPTTAIVIDDGSGTSTIRLANFGLSCNDPTAPPPFGQCGWFDLEIRLPSSYLDEAYGRVDAYDDDVTSFFSSEGESDGLGCSFGSGGGGAALFGELSILAVNETTVEIELEGWESALSSTDADGRYVAERCAP
jgi:hypothetical protein